MIFVNGSIVYKMLYLKLCVFFLPGEYESNACKHSSHCVPCEIRFPSCKGRADGINAWSGRERTPYFVVCENERLVRQGQCTYDEESHIVFDPIERACVRL